MQWHEFHFSAAHRNLDIGGKCANLHGHRYGVLFGFSTGVRRCPTEIGACFADVKSAAQHVRRLFDHGTLYDPDDVELAQWLQAGDQHRYRIDGPTSLENVAIAVFYELDKHFRNTVGHTIQELKINETDDDWLTLDRAGFLRSYQLLGLELDDAA